MADRCAVCKLTREELEGGDEGQLTEYVVKHTDGVILGVVFLCTWCLPALRKVLGLEEERDDVEQPT